MATTKLNKSMREEISKKASEDAAKTKLDELTKERNETGIALFAEVVGEEVLNALKTIPGDFTSTQERFRLGILELGEHDPKYPNHGVNFDRSVEIEFGDYILAVSDRRRYSICYAVRADNELLVKYLKLVNDIDELRVETGKAEKIILAMLSSISSVEKAIIAWPEGESYLNQYLKDGSDSLPAVRVEDVQAALIQLAA